MAKDMGNKEALVEAAQAELQRQQKKMTSYDMALPGFRFHPTEEELVGFYLRRMVQGRRNSVELIASLDLYQYDPWELPALAFMGEKEWFFFCPRDKKYPNGARPNRVTTSGYWKATGTDRTVRCTADFPCIGLKKTLVFYTGRAPRGNKTDWIMNEYRMPKLLDRCKSLALGSTSATLSDNTTTSFDYNDQVISNNDVALCRIYRKSSSGCTAGISLQTASREESDVTESDVPKSSHQQLISLLERNLQGTAQNHMIGNWNRRLALDTQAGKILQSDYSKISTQAAATFSSSLSSHQRQVLPAAANSLRSSHALMARLLEETSSYDGRNSPSIMQLSLDCNSNSTDQLEGLGAASCTCQSA